MQSRCIKGQHRNEYLGGRQSTDYAGQAVVYVIANWSVSGAAFLCVAICSQLNLTGGEGEKRKETHSKKSGMKVLLQNPKHRGLFVSQRRCRGGAPKKSFGKREGDEKEKKVGESQGESM